MNGSFGWWKPPGAMDLDISVAESLAAGNAGRHLDKRKSVVLPPSRLVDFVHNLLATPSRDTLKQLYDFVALYGRKQHSSQLLFFSASMPTLSLRLLDLLADHIVQLQSSHEGTASGSSSTSATKTGDSKSLKEAMELFYVFCKDTPIGYPSHAVGKLLQSQVGCIISSAMNGGSEDESMLKLQLLLVAVTLKINAGVRIYVKEMQRVKEFYRALTILLNSTEDAEFLVHSMTILARLVLSESLGAKLFSSKNVEQAFELVFTVLEGTWQDGNAASTSTSPVLVQPLHLQIACVDLLCDLAEQQSIVSRLEQHAKVVPVTESFLLAIHLNGNFEQIRVAMHYLSSIVALGPQFRKLVIRLMIEQDVFHRIMQVTLYPSKTIGILCARMLLRIISDDQRAMKNVFEPASKTQQLSPVIAGILRCINDASSVVQNTESFEQLCASETYQHSVEVCQVLAKMCEFSTVRALCVQTISLNQVKVVCYQKFLAIELTDAHLYLQTASLIQVESGQLGSVDPQSLLRFYPRLSINLVMLLANLMKEKSMNDKTKRTLNQFLQSSEVSLILGSAFFNRTDKEMVVNTLLLMQHFLSESNNKRFNALGLAEGIVNFGQRLTEATETLQSEISSLEANGDSQSKVIEKLQAEIQQALKLHQEAKNRHDQELKELKHKFLDQTRQKEEMLLKTREMYEAKIRELSTQCESMGQIMNKKLSTLQHREQLLQENRMKQSLLEDENNELKRKVQVLELRLEEVAQSHSVVAEEMKIRERELNQFREEMVALSTEYTSQQEDLQNAQNQVKKLQAELDDKESASENTYKELVLLAKAHKTIADERDELLQELENIREEVSSLESANLSIQSKLQERKEYSDQLERKLGRMEDAVSVNQNALDDEREKRRAACRDLDELRKAHRKLEGEIAMFEIRAAETRLMVESKDDHIRKCEEEVRQLSNEIAKHSKLQALIHQLSSGADANSIAGAYARDS
ncbi:TPA: hypothetical protein N0F65_002880 [Lagenidium giganteum]|uniref:CIP2A N-terminal domain-containing protein n=1 Tax=Lagenidium giganteum TaxID=4803 RepID=A0AAV2Z9N4_9STRA|nr:TPA: hypothetical protein N0F65_002880 [Lagenidium giganteum]